MLHKKKLQQEVQARIQFDHISKKLLERVEDNLFSRDQDKMASRMIALENSLKEERAKTLRLERELQARDQFEVHEIAGFM